MPAAWWLFTPRMSATNTSSGSRSASPGHARRSTTVEIQQHPSVKSDFGTGVLMVCSFGDQNDVRCSENSASRPSKRLILTAR